MFYALVGQHSLDGTERGCSFNKARYEDAGLVLFFARTFGDEDEGPKFDSIRAKTRTNMPFELSLNQSC